MKIPSFIAAFFLSLLVVSISGCTSVQSLAVAPAPPKFTETLIRPDQLPPPHATESHNNSPQLTTEPYPVQLEVPDGFQVNRFARGLPTARNLAVAEDGTVYVVQSGLGAILALRDPTGKGEATERHVYATGLTQPFGIAFLGEYLYVANTDSVIRYKFKVGDLIAEGKPETVVKNLPSNGYHNHWTRDILFSKDGKTLFVSVGSKENLGIEEPRRAAILAFDPDGGHFQVYASGLRNPVGLALEPSTGALWTCVNERDTIGDDLPPDYATHVVKGGFYGWPYAYIGRHPDPTYGAAHPDLVAKTLTPDVLFTAHSAAVNILFSTSKQFPTEYQGGAFVSLHGSWNRLPRTGYKVVYIPFTNGKPTNGGYKDFLIGFQQSENDVWGRPVGLAFAKDGSLLVVDDGTATIWRVSARK